MAKWCEIGPRLLLVTNRKSHITLDDFEGQYWSKNCIDCSAFFLATAGFFVLKQILNVCCYCYFCTQQQMKHRPMSAIFGEGLSSELEMTAYSLDQFKVKSNILDQSPVMSESCGRSADWDLLFCVPAFLCIFV